MLSFIIFLLLFIILFFISRALIKNLYVFFHLITHSQKTATAIIAWLFLPGTVVHELSHMLAAEILGVKTGKFNFIPEITENQKIKAASLEITKPDPFRHAIIGLAPVFAGLMAIFSLIHFFSPLIFSLSITHYPLPITKFFLLFAFYSLLFTIANTMFSSRQDLKTILFPIILTTAFIALLWYAGINIKISFSAQFTNILNQFFNQLNIGLGLAILINLVFWGIIKSFFKIKSYFK